jgi:hypothetical protein
MDAGNRRLNGQMAQRTSGRRAVNMMMPDHPQRCSEHQHEQYDRDYDAPDSLLVSHHVQDRFEGSAKLTEQCSRIL